MGLSLQLGLVALLVCWTVAHASNRLAGSDESSYANSRSPAPPAPPDQSNNRSRPPECEWLEPPSAKAAGSAGSLSGLSIQYSSSHRIGDTVDQDGHIVQCVTPFSTLVVEGALGISTDPVIYRKVVSSVQESADAMEAGGGFSASGWGAQVTASGSYMRSMMTNTSHVYVVLGAYVVQSGETSMYVDPPCLTPAAVNVLKLQGEAAFEAKYGKYFISAFKRQAWFTAVVDVEINSTASQDSVKADLQASYSGWGASASGSTSFGQQLQSMSSSQKIEVRAAASGWSDLSTFPFDANSSISAIETFVTKNSVTEGVPITSILMPFARLPHYAASLNDTVANNSITTGLSAYMIQVQKWQVQLDMHLGDAYNYAEMCEEGSTPEGWFNVTEKCMALSEVLDTFARKYLRASGEGVAKARWNIISRTINQGLVDLRRTMRFWQPTNQTKSRGCVQPSPEPSPSPSPDPSPQPSPEVPSFTLA